MMCVLGFGGLAEGGFEGGEAALEGFDSGFETLGGWGLGGVGDVGVGGDEQGVDGEADDFGDVAQAVGDAEVLEAVVFLGGDAEADAFASGFEGAGFRCFEEHWWVFRDLSFGQATAFSVTWSASRSGPGRITSQTDLSDGNSGYLVLAFWIGGG